MVFVLTLLVNIYLGIDIYFQFEQALISGIYFGKVFIFLNALLLLSFIVYPIYGNVKYGIERKKIWPLVLTWLAVVILFVFIAINFVMKGIS